VFSPELGRAAFRLALFIIVMAAGLLLTLSPGTPEFAITVLTLVVGLLFLGVVAGMVRWLGR
jgi:uncharacterized membrane protein